MGIQATNYYLLLRGTYGVLYRYRYCFLPNILPLEVFQCNNLLIHSATKLLDIQREYATTSDWQTVISYCSLRGKSHQYLTQIFYENIYAV